jgi:stage IV sporulation protein FB
MEETIEYPPKPELQIDSKPMNWGKLAFSMALFFLIFNIFLGWDELTVLSLMGVILVHEMGHFLSMKFFGYKNVSMMFMPPLGAFTSGEKDDVPYSHELITLLAGPVPGLIVGMIMLPFTNLEDPGILDKVCFMLLALNLFNMLPIIPLDGGRIFDKIFHQIRFWIRIFFLGSAILGIIVYMLASRNFDLIMALLGFIVVQNIVQTYKLVQSQKELRNQGLNPDQSYAELSDAEYWKFSNYIKSRVKMQVDENMVMMQVRRLLNHTSASRLTDQGRLVFFGIWLFFSAAPVIEFILLFPNYFAQ